MRKHAFTLIELLIVLVIIGIVAVLAIPRFRVVLINMRGAEAMTNVRALADSVWRYYQETGDFPPVNPPHVLLPDSLDAKILNPSKYFTYSYSRGVDSNGHATIQVEAQQDMTPQMMIPGVINLYRICYFFYPYPGVWYDEGAGQKMDEHWYRYYAYEVVNDYGSFDDKVGWPGSAK